MLPDTDTELTPEMVELLRSGASHVHGMICVRGQVQKNWKHLRELERLGFLRFLGSLDNPWITEAGRAAIGAPSEMEASHARLVAICAAARKPLTPAKRNDPRTDFDYRSYKTMGCVCVLAKRAPDYRTNPNTVRIVANGTIQGFGPGNSIIMPESEGPFVLAVIPDWLQRRLKLPTIGFALPEDEEWSDDERALWERLRNVCRSINTRIRNAGRGQHERRRYGETA